MRRNLGYTPDMESKGEGNFGPTNKHVAITRGDRAKPTPDMLQTNGFRPNYPMHQRAPSEAPSSVIEDNIANNYRPKKAQKVGMLSDYVIGGQRGKKHWLLCFLPCWLVVLTVSRRFPSIHMVFCLENFIRPRSSVDRSPGAARLQDGSVSSTLS